MYFSLLGSAHELRLTKKKQHSGKMAMNHQILQALQSLSSQLEGVVGRLEKLESTGVSAPGGGAAPAAAPSGGGGGGDASVVSNQCISALDILVSRTSASPLDHV